MDFTVSRIPPIHIVCFRSPPDPGIRDRMKKESQNSAQVYFFGACALHKQCHGVLCERRAQDSAVTSLLNDAYSRRVEKLLRSMTQSKNVSTHNGSNHDPIGETYEEMDSPSWIRSALLCAWRRRADTAIQPFLVWKRDGKHQLRRLSVYE